MFNLGKAGVANIARCKISRCSILELINEKKEDRGGAAY